MKVSLILLSFFGTVLAERMWAFSRDALELSDSEHVKQSESKATKLSTLETALKSQFYSLRYIDTSSMIESIASVFQGIMEPKDTTPTGPGLALHKTGAGKSSSVATEVESGVEKVESIESFYGLPRVDNPMKQMTLAGMIYRSVNAMLWLFVVLIYRLTKSPLKKDENPDTFDFSQWSSDSFDCCQDPAICFVATCCPSIRWSQTADMAGVMKYWIAIAFLFVTYVLLPVDIYFAMFAGVVIGGRSRLRQIYSMKGHGDCGTICGDILLIWCCPWFAIAQEARHVEAATKACVLGEPVEINPPDRKSVV